MANYTIHLLPESAVSVTNGVSLDGITQGDGSHLVGEFLTLDPGPLTPLDVRDRGGDNNFDDNDGNQRLDSTQTLDGVSYGNGTRIEAEYQIDVRAPDGTVYTIVSVNLNNSSPAYGTVEGLAFVDAIPPRGVPLEVIAAREGPGSFGQPAINQSSFVPCFCAGTLIGTPQGRVAVETVRPGDRILTNRGQASTVRWIGRRRIGAARLARNPKLRPIRIKAGALGSGLPYRDLLVSRQHRMLVQSRIAERMFGQAEVLIPAVNLTALPGIDIDATATEADYLHLLFDRHEVIFAEGAPSESLYTGPGAMAALGPEAREEILALFPELLAMTDLPEPARLVPKGRQQKQLIARHARNNKPLVFAPA